MSRSLRTFIVILLYLSAITIIRASEDVTRVNVDSESPDKSSRIFGSIELLTAQDQELFVYNGIDKKKRLFAKLPFRYDPQITWHRNDLVEVMVGTGSPGRFSIFYDLRKDVFSKHMWFVLAFDKSRRLALLGEDRLLIYSVFENKEIMEIKRNDIQKTAFTFLVVEASEFDDEGNLHIKYLTKSGGTKSEVIDLSQIGK